MSESKTETAHAIVSALSSKNEEQEGTGLFEVNATQFITHGTKKYNVFENIEGLLLTIKNISIQNQTLKARRGCQVVYKIFNADSVLLYDSSKKEQCTQHDMVLYTLSPGKTRMFPMVHEVKDYRLLKGTYRIQMEYPGYGKDSVSITIE